MIEYVSEQKITLSLRGKVVSREFYENKIEDVFHYGKQVINPKISVVIVAFNEKEDLIRNLDHLASQSNQNFEILIIDNGFDYATKKKLKKYSLVHIILKENLGPSTGRNIGALYSNAALLVFVDADGYVKKDFVEKIIFRMSDTAVVALRGKVLPIEQHVDKAMIPHGYNLGDTVISSCIDTEGCSAFRTEDYIKVGGMEDDLFGHEGVVMGHRMCEFYDYNRDAFIYDPEVILYHDHHNTDGKLEKKSRRYTILDKQIDLRYPFYREYIKYYSNIRKKNVRSKPVVEKQIFRVSQDIRDNILNEYTILDEKRKQLRYGNSDYMKKGDTKDFSVIIPCYNLGSLLQKAIDSVFAQTLDDIEVIVVDDASPDNETQKVLDDIERLVHVVRLKENSGVSVARNEGIKIAKSEYVLCLDADDTIEPTYLEKAKNIFDADEKVGLVSCYLKSFGKVSLEWKPIDKIGIKDALVDSPVHTASCFRKSLHDLCSGYDTDLRGYEDWDHWIRIMRLNCSVRVIPETLFNYYMRADSKVKTSNNNSKDLVVTIVNNHRDLYEKYVDYVFAQKHYEWVVRDALFMELQGSLQGYRFETLSQKDKELLDIKNSKSFRLGNLFFRSIKNPIKIITFPVNFIRIVFL